MTVLDRYIKEQIPQNSKYAANAEVWRQAFVKDFPVESIMNLSLYDFLYSNKGLGNDNSFCSRLWNNKLASLGNSRSDIFGIYSSNGNDYKMHKRFENECADFESAFHLIKREIVNLLSAGKSKDLKSIEKNKLIRTFKYLLLATYFNYYYIPAPTSTALNAYCDAIQLPYNSKDDPIYRNVALVDWGKRVAEMQDWNTYQLMQFLDWMWRSKVKVDYKTLEKPKYQFKKPEQAEYGRFDSWEIYNDNTAAKETGFSWFEHNGSAISAKARWFFEVDTLPNGERRDISLLYNGNRYSANIIRDSNDLGRTRLFWESQLGIAFNEYFKTVENYPLILFSRSDKDEYSLSFLPGGNAKLVEPLDNTHTPEEQASQAEQMDANSLKAAAEKRSNDKPSRKEVTTVQTARDPYIAEYAKARAKGICQLCGQAAPFFDAKGRPYLESHHIIWLSEGGPDSVDNTAALCPNCHRRMHILRDPLDVEKLKSAVIGS